MPRDSKLEGLMGLMEMTHVKIFFPDRRQAVLTWDEYVALPEEEAMGTIVCPLSAEDAAVEIEKQKAVMQ